MTDFKKSILIVEDDLEFRKPLSDFFSARGYEVSVADDGEQAIDRLLIHKPSVVILDLLLPKLYGTDVLKKIREYPDEEVKRTPVIILSNVSSDRDIKLTEELGVSAYFVKSQVRTEEVFFKVRQVIFGDSAPEENELVDFSHM